MGKQKKADEAHQLKWNKHHLKSSSICSSGGRSTRTGTLSSSKRIPRTISAKDSRSRHASLFQNRLATKIRSYWECYRTVGMLTQTSIRAMMQAKLHLKTKLCSLRVSKHWASAQTAPKVQNHTS